MRMRVDRARINQVVVVRVVNPTHWLFFWPILMPSRNGRARIKRNRRRSMNSLPSSMPLPASDRGIMLQRVISFINTPKKNIVWMARRSILMRTRTRIRMKPSSFTTLKAASTTASDFTSLCHPYVYLRTVNRSMLPDGMSSFGL